MPKESDKDRETQKMETMETEEEAPTEQPDHDAVPVDGVCQKCGWHWGSADPHPVFFGQSRNEPDPTVAKPKGVERKPDGPDICAPVALQGTCEKCGWNYEAEMKKERPSPHPVLGV